MDKTFSLYRVGLLLKRQWASFGKIFLIALGALTLVILGVYLFNLPTKENITTFRLDENLIRLNFPIFVFIYAGALFISLSSAWYFSKWGKRANAIEDLLLPASNLEKFICGFIFTQIVCIVSYFIVFSLIDSGYRFYLNEFVKGIDRKVGMQNANVLYYKNTMVISFIDFIGIKDVLTVVVGLFFLQSLFFIGSVYFQRFQYVKTLMLSTAFVLLVFFASIKWMEYATKGKVQVFNTVRDIENQHSSNIPMFFYVLIIATIIVYYCATYLRIKEKEI